jgi:tetratricopeptide (TPR) repeat protein
MPAPIETIVGRWAIAACLCVAAGCATEDVQSGLKKVTPSFLLSEQDRAERNLKDPAALHLAYGQFQERTGQPGEARKSYDAALRDNPQSVDAILGIARLDQLADNAKDAEAGFQKALRLKPGDAKVIASLGQFYVSQKRWPEAFQSLNAAIAAAPNEAFYKHELAVAKTVSGDINGGLVLFTQLIGPEKAHYNVAYLLRQQGNAEAAARECQVCLRINPNFEPAKAMLSQIHDRQVAESRAAAPAVVQRAAAAAPAPQGSPGPGQAQAVGVGTSNQPALGASQVSWQSSSRASNPLPMTSGDAPFDTAASKSPAAPGPRSGVPNATSDPWGQPSP